MSVLRELLVKAVAVEASDIHVKTSRDPFFRIHGELVKSGAGEITPERMSEIIGDILPSHLAESFLASHEADFSLDEEGVGRFRVNVFLAQGFPAIAMRQVRTDIPSFETLRLPSQTKELARVERGIVVIAGTTGSGKSTTLAAIIGEINRTQRRRIITIEDPVEYLFIDDKSVITQREIGLDTLDYNTALEHVLRQNPDVILIGEMRDQLGIRTGLLAAETGHLVLTTMHSGTASIAVPRMLDVFPADEQDQVRKAFAETLHAVICQRLIPDTQDDVVPAVEIMINTPTVRKLLEKSRLSVLASAIETGVDDGMQTFDQSIYGLVKAGTITEKEGMRFATNPESLRMNLRGIFLDEGKRILKNN